MTFDAPALRRYLRDHIPLAAAMDICVRAADELEVTLEAPLAPNINHRETVFGGSAAALATLAAWTLLHARLATAGLPSRLVIQRSTMDYVAPIPADFTATARLADSASWPRFEQMLRRRGRARISTRATLRCNGQDVGEFAGDFVAVGRENAAARPGTDGKR